MSQRVVIARVPLRRTRGVPNRRGTTVVILITSQGRDEEKNK